MAATWHLTLRNIRKVFDITGCTFTNRMGLTELLAPSSEAVTPVITFNLHKGPCWLEAYIIGIVGGETWWFTGKLELR